MGSRVISRNRKGKYIVKEVVRPSKKTMISVTRTNSKYCETPLRPVM